MRWATAIAPSCRSAPTAAWAPSRFSRTDKDMTIRYSLWTAVAIAALFASVAQAAVTRFEVQSHRSFGTFRTGEVILVEGKVFGELDPREDMGIPGLDKAPRNSDGRVEYSARVV